MAVVQPVTTSTAAAPSAPPTTVAATAPEVELLGRWDRQDDVATTVNSGSRVRLRFTGRQVTALFDQTGVTRPPQIYTRIDGGAPRLHTVDRGRINLTKRALSPGVHELEIIVKDVDERANRWNPRLASALRLSGFRLSNGAEVRPAKTPDGPRIEFLGDSITQGVRAIGPQIGIDGADATKTYAWLTGQAFGGDFRQVGFGAQGITVPGGGEVPVAAESLGLNFAGSPVDARYVPDAVVVNQGTNDALGGNLDGFEDAYLTYLRDIRERWPEARIFALRPFGGHTAAEIRSAVQRLGDPRAAYVDTTGWVAHHWQTDGLHPSHTGHVAAARKLVKEISDRTGWEADVVPGARAELLAAGGSPGFEGADSGWAPGPRMDDVAVAEATTPAAYEGSRVLRATAGDASARAWHSVVLDQPVQLPKDARNLFAFVALPELASGATFDARIEVVRDGRRQVRVFHDLPNLSGFLPWSRIHVDLPTGGDLSRIAISVRAASDGAAGSMDLHLDAVGWSDLRDG